MPLIKQYGVWIALALTLLATWRASQQEDSGEVVGVVKERETKVEARPEAQKQVSLIANEQLIEADATLMNDDVPQNIFTALAPPTVQPTEAANAAPAMPANPFVYGGKIVDGTQMTVFLLNADKSYAVKVGDVLEDVWKVKAIKPPNMTLRYLPLKIDTQLDIGVLN